MQAPAKLKAYLKATGWTQARFARVVGMKRCMVSLIASGARPCSAHHALLIAQGTEAAKRSGITSVPPLTVVDMLPEFAAAKAG